LRRWCSEKRIRDPDFVRSLTGKKAKLRVTYLDQGEEAFTVLSGQLAVQEKLAGSGRSETAEFDIATPDVITIQGTSQLTLHMVEVRRHSPGEA
jgi:hypothetical protein